MADFLESAKSMVNAAVSRTSWEAQKQMRVRSKQTEVDKLLEQRQQLLDELGQIAMTLYQQGKLTDQQLSRLCASIQELDHDVQNREMQLQEVKSEVYQANQFAPASTPDSTPPVSSSTPSASQPSKSGAKSLLCAVCGTPIRSNALYCRSCGTKLR
jgi:seryl-tRNA synthetase